MSSQLLVLEYLKTHTFGELETEHGVNVSVSKSHPYKLSVNYDQIASKPSPLVNQCRGLILRTADASELPADSKELAKVCPGSMIVLARPFDRFFNHGDPSAASIDWDDPELEVQEKLDGTLAIVYYDDVMAKWCMGTRSVPDADLPFDWYGVQMTYRDLFDKALLNSTGLDDLEEFAYGVSSDLTFCFELTAPQNRIVVQYDQEALTWLGTRNRLTGDEMRYHEVMKDVPGDFCRYFPKRAVVFPNKSLESALAMISTKAATEMEGVVVVDSKFRRMKVKSVAWLAANRVKTACGSQRGLLQLILMGKDDDVLAIMPEQAKPQIPRLKGLLSAMCGRLDSAHGDFLRASGGDRKAYAIMVTGDPGIWSSPMFDMFQGRSANARAWIMSKADKSGEWPDAFLDRLIDQLNRVE